MQLPLFQETHEPDTDALQRCLQAEVVALDVETDTRWPGHGPRVDYGLSYSAEVSVLALAWCEDDEIRTTALAAPFQSPLREYLKTLFQPPRWIVAHNAVFDVRQLSKLTSGQIPQQIWDTQAMARLLHPAVDLSYSLLSVATALGISFPERQQTLKGQRSSLHRRPSTLPFSMRRMMRVWRCKSITASGRYRRMRHLSSGNVALCGNTARWRCRGSA